MFKLEFKVLEYIKVLKFWSLCIQNIVTGKIFDSKLLNQNGDLKFDDSHFIFWQCLTSGKIGVVNLFHISNFDNV